jgi:hypothetical protein
MSTDFSIRPVGAPVAASFLPATGDAARSGVPAQLPTSQTVTAGEAGGGARNDPQDPTGDVSRQAFFDTAASAVVFQSIDSLTGQVVQQFPDDATLRRRAYFHSLDLAKESSTHPVPTDVTA